MTAATLTLLLVVKYTVTVSSLCSGVGTAMAIARWLRLHWAGDARDYHPVGRILNVYTGAEPHGYGPLDRRAHASA